MQELKKLIASNTKYFLKTLYRTIKNSNNPTYKMPKKYLSKIFLRLISNNYEFAFGRIVKRALKKMKGIEILIIGHSHAAKEEEVKHKKIIYTGTWRDEYALSRHTDMLRSKGKYFAEITVAGGRVIGARLIKHKSTNKSSDARILDYLKERDDRLLAKKI